MALNLDVPIAEDRREETRTLLERLRRGDSVQVFNTRRLTKDGRTIDVRLTASVLRDEAENITTIATTERESDSHCAGKSTDHE